MDILKACAFCQQPATLMCSRCLEVYCSFECQIRDWSEHKKICVTVPKLYPNGSYLDLLTGGVRLPQRNSITIEQKSIQLISNGQTARPNLPLQSVQVSVDRKAFESISNEQNAAPSHKSQGVSEFGETVKRISRMKLVDVPDSPTDNGHKSTESSVGEKPRTSPGIEQDKTPKKVVPAITKPRQPWMLPFPLEKSEGEPIEVVVQHVARKKSNLCWVMLVDHEPRCDQLLRDINVQAQLPADPVKYDDIQVNDLFTGPFEDVFYRMVVLQKINPERSLVKVRLIDYGNELTVPAADLRAPLPQMKELHALAFLIEIQNLDEPLESSAVIRVNLVRSESDRMVVDMVQANEGSLLSVLGHAKESTGEGGIVAILSSRKALILLSCATVLPIMKVLYTQLAEVASTFPVAEGSKVGDLVCVNSVDFGWSRALIIERHEDNLLAYTVDNGAVELVNAQDVRKLPAEYRHKPRLVLTMEVTKILMDEEEFKRICYMPSFAFTFERLSFDQAQQRMKCTIKDSKGQQALAEVDLLTFECDLKKIGIAYWPHTPQDKTIVRILSALDPTTIVICPKENINAYTELLKTVVPNLKRLTTAPKAKDIVVAVDDCAKPYRARVLWIVSPAEVQVLDLDNGRSRKASLDRTYEANEFVNNLPVYTLKVRIWDMIETAVKDPAPILEQLEAFRCEKREFTMIFEDRSYMHGVKLIDVGTNRSLGTILLDHHDKKLRELEEIAKLKREQEEEAARQKAAAAAAEAAAAAATAKEEQERKAREAEALQKAKTAAAPKIFTINDLEMVKLPVGKNDTKLTILDDTHLPQGVITVFEFTDENIKRYTTLNDLVNEEAAKVGGDGYCPKCDEMCIAVFDDDKLWYRAVCLQAEPEKNTFMVQFIDFGNLAEVKRGAIRSLPKQLDFPCAAHTCSVIDHTSVMKKLIELQSSQGYVVAREILSEGEQYSLRF